MNFNNFDLDDLSIDDLDKSTMITTNVFDNHDDSNGEKEGRIEWKFPGERAQGEILHACQSFL